MRKLLKKILCCALLAAMVTTGGIAVSEVNTITADAAEVQNESAAANGIVIHY